LREVPEWIDAGEPWNKRLVARDYAGDRLPAAVGAHVARGAPARVLREVAAKRAHLTAYEGAINGCLEWGITTMLENILYSDAAVWSDHPDYKQEWAPSP
jgi:hypothetical protein